MNSLQVVPATTMIKPTRVNSNILRSYPWKTPFLEVKNISEIFKDEDLKTFSEKVMKFEDMISSSSMGDGFRVRTFLGFEKSYSHLGNLIPTHPPSSITDLTTRSKSLLSTLLLAYRTIDIAAAQDGYLDLELTAKIETPRTGTFGECKEVMGRVHEWPDLLRKFSHIISAPNPIAGKISHDDTQSSEDSGLKRHLAVLNSLASCKEATTGLINIQLAVISLHRLLNQTEIDPLIDANDLEQLKKYCSSTDKLELPIRLAFFLSPIILLIPKSIHKLKGRIDIFDVMETGKALGDKTPPLLKRVEKELFATIFRLATQELDLMTEMKECMSRMPWRDLTLLDESETSWFRPIPSLTEDMDVDEDDQNIPRPSTSTLGGPSHQTHNMDVEEEEQNTPQPSASTSGAALRQMGKNVEEDERNMPRPSASTSGAALRQTHNNVEEDERNMSRPSASTSGAALRQTRNNVEEDDRNMEVDDPPVRQLRPRHGAGKRKEPPSADYVSPRIKVKRPRDAAPSAKGKQGLGDSRSMPIDVDELFEWRKLTLDLEDSPIKYNGKTILGYEPSGEVYEFRPRIQVEEDLPLLESFSEAVKAGFEDGLPLHISNPQKSCFTIMTESAFEEKTAEEIQDLLRKNHLLITEMRSTPLHFDARGLSTLTSLSTVSDIQDQSIGRDPDTESYSENRLRQGRVSSFLESAKHDGKILNGLNFPMPEEGMGRLAFSTDSTAWKATKGALGCSYEEAPPMGDIRWGLAATAGALSWIHIDSNGLGTYVDVKAGKKWWIVLKRKGEGRDFKSCSDGEGFFGGDYNVDEPNLNDWEFEAIVLTPGTRLIMRPNTPHAVFTPEHSICHGGHFYSTSTMRDTMFAIVNTFIAPVALTNNDHRSHGIFLRRIAAFYHETLVNRKDLEEGVFDFGHVPRLTDFDSLIDLLSFCNILILANVLDHRTYDEDVDAIPVKERYEMAYARGRCWDILLWVFHFYEVFEKRTGEEIDGFSEVGMGYLAHLGLVIIEFKSLVVNTDMDADNNRFTIKALTRQVETCFKGYSTIPPLDEFSMDREGSNSLEFPGSEKYGLRARISPPPFSSSTDLLKLGTTEGDRKFFKYGKE